MDDLPQFSQILVNRRMELGVTIDQVARALNLKERVLVAFEQGDWESMPKSGYAQGMLSSYARYLGLDSREITGLFADELADYQNRRGNYDEPLRGPDSTNVVSTSEARRVRRYSGARGLLPTSGGYAGDMEGFSTVQPVGGSRPSGYGSSGNSGSYSGYGSSVSLTGARAASSYGTGTSGARGLDDGYGSETGAAPRRTRKRDGYRPRVPVDSRSGGRSRSMRRSDQVRTRRIEADEFVDDLRYNDQAETYTAASTSAGRAGYRNLASPERPRVRRRATREERSRLERRNNTRSGGIVGTVASVFQGNARLAAIVVLVTAVILTVIIISSVGSCVGRWTSNGREETNKPEVTTVEEGSQAQDATTTETQPATTTETTPQPTTTTTEQPETKVEVTVAVADAGISWVEITLDGVSQVAETMTGPWSATYNVTRSIKIDVSEPTVVTVTRNGVQQTFDSRASGVGTITIDGPAQPETNEEQTSTSDSNVDESTQSTEEFVPIQYNDDGSWYDQNWLYHDGEGGYYDDNGEYQLEYEE